MVNYNQKFNLDYGRFEYNATIRGYSVHIRPSWMGWLCTITKEGFEHKRLVKGNAERAMAWAEKWIVSKEAK